MDNPLLLPALLCLLLPAIHSDLSTRRIPDWLSLTGCVAGPVLAATGHGSSGLLLSLFALGVAFAVGFLFWLCGWLGAGDVKLLAAVGALCGPALLPRVLLLTAFSGGVLAVLVMLWQGRTRATLRHLLTRPGRRLPPSAADDPAHAHRLPYALAIAAGSLLAVLQGGAGLPA